MTNEELNQAIKDAIAEILPAMVQDAILPEVRKENGKFAAKYERKFESLAANLQPTQEAQDTQDVQEETQKPEKLSLKALQSEIHTLREQLAEKDQKAFLAARDSAISKAVASAKAVNPSALQKLFTFQFGETLKQEGEKWFIEQADSVKSLEQVLSDYLNSEEGQSFQAPSGVNGSGSQETKSAPAQPNQKLTATEAVNAAFANF